MPDSLPVHVSREELHSLEVPASFETTGSFDVLLRNHAESLHIHLHLDDALSEVAELDAGNHYVEGESERRVRVTVDTDRIDDELIGKLKVASAYGAETRWVDITVSEPDPEADTVQVDESLATPQPRTDDQQLSISRAVPMLTLGGLAIILLGLAALLFEGTVVIVGAVVVLGGLLSALFFLARDNDAL